MGPGVQWEQYHPQQKAILKVAQVINMKKEIKKDCLYQLGNIGINQSIYQSITKSGSMVETERRSLNTGGEGRLRAIA